MPPSQVFADFLELGQRCLAGGWVRASLRFQAVIDMVVYQRFFRIGDGFFNGVQLLRDFDAVAARFDHRDGAAQMAFGAFQTQYDAAMAIVMRVLWGCVGYAFHAFIVSPWGGWVK